MNKGLKEDSLKDFDKCIEIDPKNASAFYFRGNLKYILGLK
jgi:hypothetical protein